MTLLFTLCTCCSVTQSSLTLLTPWTAACQASLSFIISQSLLKLMSIESVMPPNHLVLCCPLLLLPSTFPSIRVFSSKSAFCKKWPNCWNFSISISQPPMNIQDWYPLELTGLISLQSEGLSSLLEHHSQKHQFFSVQPSLWSNSYTHTWLLEKP